MSISIIIGIIGGLFGLIGLVTVAVIIVRSNIATTTATLWQGEAAALKNKNERLEVDSENLTKENENLRAQYKILEGIKSGTAEITNLTKEVVSTGRKTLNAIEEISYDINAVKTLIVKEQE